MVSRATRSCSGEWKKMAERYWVPTSAPWRLRVVGSWMEKKTSRMSLNPMREGSKVSWMTSAWPVEPEQTAS